MVAINPVRRALVPVDSSAADRLCSPNYDEFQSDEEITDLLGRQPESVLRVTMPHCNPVAPGETAPEEGSPEALEVARSMMSALIESPSTRLVEDVLWVYEIISPLRPSGRQIGLGGLAQIRDIRTATTPSGAIIRNEGIREAKAKGRADLISATRSFIGVVNNAVDDDARGLTRALESHADGRDADFRALDERGNRHGVWLVSEPGEIRALTNLLAAEPWAYVADGNHRSAAAAMLGGEHFLAVFFPAHTMGLAPYNRLVDVPVPPDDHLEAALSPHFTCERLGAVAPFQPVDTHEIGLYARGKWWKLTPRASSFDPENAVQSIDADIVQRTIFDGLFGIGDPADKRFTFVGGDREAAYLVAQVDCGRHALAITLPPVTMDQFIAVCRQNRIMPPKSTWFQPKIRSGLVIALLD